MDSPRQSFTGNYAPIIIGVFLCLLTSHCREAQRFTETWVNLPETERNHDNGYSNDGSASASAVKSQQPGHNAPTRFLAYNLKNYLTMRRYVDGKAVYRHKPQEEIDALIEIISSAKPDILGLCEIGTHADLEDLQKRLKTAGINLPHSHRVSGSDRTRALGLLSRYPIVSTGKPQKTNYTIGGAPFTISRGILDTTVQLPHKSIRLLGIHFKSKRPVPDADQALMRRNESLLLRKHIEDILRHQSDTPLLVYGDFNDTRNSKSVSSVRGRSNSSAHMKIIELLDKRGQSWTHHWKHEDIYSRIDFVMTNSVLEPFIKKEACKLLDPENWETASDHRPMLIVIE